MFSWYFGTEMPGRWGEGRPEKKGAIRGRWAALLYLEELGVIVAGGN